MFEFFFTQPLALENLLVTTFSGTAEIFIFIGMIFIAALAARFRMPNGIALVMFLIFLVIMSGTSLSGSISGLFVFGVTLVAMLVFWGVSRYFK